MSLLNNVQNYYESLTLEVLAELIKDKEYSEDALSDALCIALNNLPPRYIRHSVDMAYYTPPAERHEAAEKARAAVTSALEYIEQHNRS